VTARGASLGGQVTQEFTLTIGGLQNTPSLPPLTLGVPYSVQLTSTGGVAPLKWAKVGKLPQGLTLSKSGVLSGTVVAKHASPGAHPVSVSVTDATKKKHQSQSKTFSLQINS
jgi:hypothetical protein